MGLLEDIVGKVQQQMGASHTPKHSDLIGHLMQMLGSGGGLGGLAGLTQLFNQGGLGNIVQSWIGTGQNLPISPAQLQQVLGNGQLQQLAAKMGMDQNQLTQELAHLLPRVVDHLTPAGTLPEGDLMGGAMDMLKKLL
jgi:uncharacterized protein YidB (DUF937 family)